MLKSVSNSYKATSAVGSRNLSSAFIINYNQHPLYRTLSKPLKVKAAAILIFALSAVRVILKTLTMYIFIPPASRNPFSFSFYKSVVAIYTSRFVSIFNTYSPHSRSASYIYSELTKYGICKLNADLCANEKLLNLLKTQINLLRVKRGDTNTSRKFAESRYLLDNAEHSTIYSLCNQLFHSLGIFEASNAYFKRFTSLVEIVPQVNDSSDAFWRESMGSEVPAQVLPKTTYMHFDAFGDHLKAIVYLSDVSLESSGPFRYVKGSHYPAFSLTRFLAKVIDQSGLSSQDPQSRMLFAALPRFLQYKCAFGNDVLDSYYLSDLLTRSESVFYGQELTIILFDVSGVHRGGMVDIGERAVSTCVIG